MSDMDIWAQLREPFAAGDIEWRVQRCGVKGDKPWAMVLAYVTNRAIMDRLDAVVGPANWRNEFREAPGGGILCGLSVRCDENLLVDAYWITKWDGAEQTEIEAVKGGLSGAMKRAGVQWGIGRYLYHLPTGFADCSTDQRQYPHRGYHKETKTAFSWQPPALPGWALPGGGGRPGGETGAYAPKPKTTSGKPKGTATKAKDLVGRMKGADCESALRAVAAEAANFDWSDKSKLSLNDCFHARLVEFNQAGATFKDSDFDKEPTR